MTRDLHAWLRVEPDFGRIKEPQRVPSILLIHQFFGVKHGVSNTNLFFFYLKKNLYVLFYTLKSKFWRNYHSRGWESQLTSLSCGCQPHSRKNCGWLICFVFGCNLNKMYIFRNIIYVYVCSWVVWVLQHRFCLVWDRIAMCV